MKVTHVTRNRIYFIADAHVGGGSHSDPARQEDRLIGFLRSIHRDAQVLYIVGDLFDFWFEYRSVVPSIGARVLFEIYALVQAGVRVVCLPGNHDIWLGAYLSEQVGLELPGGPIVATHQGLTFYIAHGDEFRTDWRFRVSRAILKNPTCIALYRLLHPDLGALLARTTSRISIYRARRNATGSRGVFLPAAKAKIAQGIDIVLCGHYHSPTREPLDGGALIILGDWISNDTYAVLENGEIELQKW